MRYSDIKVGHVYFADLEPVRPYEFGKNHLSIVLSKGKDKRSVTIVSLTSEESGVGENKIDIGILPFLPQRLTQDKNGNEVKSYVVLDQVRTVVAGRIQYVVDGRKSDGSKNTIDCLVPPVLFSQIVHELTNLRIADLNDENAIGEYHKNAFLQYCVKKMIDLTYDIIKERGDLANKKGEIIYFHESAVAIEKGFLIDAYLQPRDVKNKISERISEIVTLSVK